MRSVPTAAIAYGYRLGNPDRWTVKEANGLGALNLDWFCDVGDRASCHDFVTAAASHLSFHGASNGLSFITYGDYVALVARNSYRVTNGWGDSLPVTPEALTPPERSVWDVRLARALAVLGLTPHQDAPEWRILPLLSN